MNYPAMADDIAALLNSMHIDSAVVAGHSMGGKTAMKFALRYPHRVNKLVVLDIAPVKYPHHVNLALLKKMQALDLIGSQTCNRPQEELPITDRTVKLFLLQNLVRDQGAAQVEAQPGRHQGGPENHILLPQAQQEHRQASIICAWHKI